MAKEWWQEISVDAHLQSLQRHADREVTLEEVNFIEANIPLTLGSKILDLACGEGRHSAELSQRGYKVYGLDYTLQLLNIALAKEGNAQFVNGNMLEIPFRDDCFDAVLSMWQSLGYFKSEIENDRVFSEISRVLVPQGTIILQVNNPIYTIANLLSKEGVAEAGKLVARRNEMSGENIIIKTESFDPSTFRYESRRKLNFEPEEAEVIHDMRYFSLPELFSKLTANDLDPVNCYGSIRGEPYGFSSEQIVLIARKTA